VVVPREKQTEKKSRSNQENGQWSMAPEFSTSQPLVEIPTHQTLEMVNRDRSITKNKISNPRLEPAMQSMQ
jgi:hypothetical protein